MVPRESGLFQFAELWLEGDSLLYIHSSRVSERYTRYRLDDIQALVLTELPLWNLWRALWLGISFFATSLLLIASPRLWKLWAVVPGIAFVWAISHVLRGTRCRLVLHTAVSSVVIEAVRTMSAAKTAMPILQSLVESRQGVLEADRLTVSPPPARPVIVPEAKNSPLLLYTLYGIVIAHVILLGTLYYAGQSDDGVSLSAVFLFTELVMGVIVGTRWKAVGPVLTGLSVLLALLALLDGGVLLYTTAETLGGFFSSAAKGRAVRPEDLKLLWLKEQTVVRTLWHAAIGLAGWVAIIASRDRAQ